MADRYLLESGAPDGYLLEDGSGVLLLEVLGPLGISYGNVDTPYQHKKQKVVTTTEYPNLVLKLEPVNNKVPRTPLYVRVDRHQFSNEIDYVNWALYHPTASVTGTLATTNANDTLAASGSPVVSGSLGTTNSNDTLSASGSPIVAGSLSTTNANDTLSASGGSSVTGTLATTNANDTLSSSGTTAIVGTLSTTNNNDTLSASGSAGTPDTSIFRNPIVFNSRVRKPNVVDTTLPNALLSRAPIAVSGTLVYTNNNDTLAASGDAGPVDAPPGKVLFIPTPPRKKMVAVEPYTNKLLTVYEPQKIASGLPESSNPVQKRQLPKVDVYSNWALFRTLNTITGTSSTTNANDTLAATGSVTVVGNLSRTNANDTSTGQGTTTVVGAGSSTNANDTLAASGSVGNNISGSLAYTNNNDTSTGQGSSTVLGVLATTNNNDTSTGQGTTVVVGTLARTNNNDTLSASGFPGNPPTATTRLPLTGAGT